MLFKYLKIIYVNMLFFLEKLTYIDSKVDSNNMNNNVNFFQLKVNQLLTMQNELNQKMDIIIFKQDDSAQKEQNKDESFRKLLENIDLK